LRSPLTRRLFELVNLLADEGKRDFDFNLNELAHEHLGLSQKITAPSQVWGKIAPSFSTLAERGILDSYELNKPSLRITGRIGVELQKTFWPQLVVLKNLWPPQYLV
jgi:hypothetical protein